MAAQFTGYNSGIFNFLCQTMGYYTVNAPETTYKSNTASSSKTTTMSADNKLNHSLITNGSSIPNVMIQAESKATPNSTIGKPVAKPVNGYTGMNSKNIITSEPTQQQLEHPNGQTAINSIATISSSVTNTKNGIQTSLHQSGVSQNTVLQNNLNSTTSNSHSHTIKQPLQTSSSTSKATSSSTTSSAKNVTASAINTAITTVEAATSNSSSIASSTIANTTSSTNKPVPMSPEQVLKMYTHKLTQFERTEITNYNNIYFIGPNAKKRVGTSSSHNNGFDDDQGSYILVQHDHIAYRYEVLKIIGKGSFGQVIKAYDHKTQSYVSIKIVRNEKRFHRQAHEEIRILTHLRKQDKDNSMNVVHLFEHFNFRNHICMTFELLSYNLYEVIKRNKFQGFSLHLVRKFALNIILCLDALHKNKIIHCDLKPENVLLKTKVSWITKLNPEFSSRSVM